MIVLHGLLGGHLNLRYMCAKSSIAKHFTSHLLEMRNHAESDHHDDHNYKVMSDDVIRYADKNEIDHFSLMGHSMGGRLAMTLA